MTVWLAAVVGGGYSPGSGNPDRIVVVPDRGGPGRAAVQGSLGSGEVEEAKQVKSRKSGTAVVRDSVRGRL